MKNIEDLKKKKIRDLSNKELDICFSNIIEENKDASHSFNRMLAYTIELQRRGNGRVNKIMIICTIAITIMTAVVLWATLVSAGIISCG